MNRYETITRMLVNAGYLVTNNGAGITVSLPNGLVSIEEIAKILKDDIYDGEVFTHNYNLMIDLYHW